MGIIKRHSLAQRKIEKEEAEDFEKRKKGFAEDYRVLVDKWQVDYEALLGFVGGGAGGIVPRIKAVDIKVRKKKV